MDPAQDFTLNLIGVVGEDGISQEYYIKSSRRVAGNKVVLTDLHEITNLFIQDPKPVLFPEPAIQQVPGHLPN